MYIHWVERSRNEILSPTIARGMDAPLDCLIVGGGPAGLTAATYLARFHLKLKLVDAGKSRAAMIPCTHNHAGYPGGISRNKR